MAEPTLRELQAWMSVVVEHRRDAEAGAHSKAATQIIPFGIVKRGEVVLPNERMDPFQRLDVYNGGYFARLRDVLESDHAGLVHALGEPSWNHLALGYLHRHPSRHPNLNRLNKKLPGYIASRKGLPNRAFLRDLARIEVAVTLAFDAPHFEPMDMTRLSDLAPEEWERVVFVPNPSVHLLSLSYPANAYLQAAYDDKDPRIPGRKSTYLAVYRKEHRVWRADLTKPMFQVLSALCDGKPFAKALAAAPAGGDSVTRWFASWSADGLFADALV